MSAPGIPVDFSDSSNHPLGVADTFRSDKFGEIVRCLDEARQRRTHGGNHRTSRTKRRGPRRGGPAFDGWSGGYLSTKWFTGFDESHVQTQPHHRLIEVVPLEQHQFDALVSFIFNPVRALWRNPSLSVSVDAGLEAKGKFRAALLQTDAGAPVGHTTLS